MRQSTTLLVFLLVVSASQVFAAPQFISFNEGKLGVNFGGYKAAVGLGGLLGGGGGAGGGLFAEAGTPFGQNARAGLGGAVDSNGGSAGGLYAGATAGGNVKAAAGLGGGVTAEKSAGTGFASAQAGDHFASSGLGGETSAAGSTGFSFSGSKSFGVSSGVVKEVDVQPVPTVQVVKPVYKEVYTEVAKPVYTEVAKPVYKEVHTEIKTDTANEVQPAFVPLAPVAKTDVRASFDINAQVPPATIVKEVSKMWGQIGTHHRHNYSPNVFQDVMSSVFRVSASQSPGFIRRSWQMPQQIINYRFSQVYVPPPTKVVEKQYVRYYKPHRHHLRKHAYIGGYIGGGGYGFPEPPPAPVVYKTVQPAVYKTIQVQPAIEKRVDIDAGAAVNAGAAAHAGGAGQVGYTKQVAFQSNPTFFADIFNIPISTLQAVRNLVTNAAGSTSVSVQKSASLQADTDTLSSKHEPSSSVSTSDSHLSVQLPTASKFIDDIFSIPINTLGAVNKFLENNVPARKSVQVTQDGEPTQVKLRPHGRRRANKQVVLVQEDIEKSEAYSKVTE